MYIHQTFLEVFEEFLYARFMIKVEDMKIDGEHGRVFKDGRLIIIYKEDENTYRFFSPDKKFVNDIQVMFNEMIEQAQKETQNSDT